MARVLGDWIRFLSQSHVLIGRGLVIGEKKVPWRSEDEVPTVPTRKPVSSTGTLSGLLQTMEREDAGALRPGSLASPAQVFSL